MNCLIIQQDGGRQNKQNNLKSALQDSGFMLQHHYVNNPVELETQLDTLPELLFCPDSASPLHKEKLQQLVYQLAPDCIVVYYAVQQWRGLSSFADDVQIAALQLDQPEHTVQQLHYLLSYARLQTEFRHCKHLLRIVEQRSQWLVDYAREAVAYISRNQHLYVNATYLSLFGFDAEIDALSLGVLKLVSARHHKSFLSLSLETEQKISLPNKLLLDMNTVQGRPFRAEVRFIPSVFRGQRCVQLHVHPLLDTTAAKPRSSAKAAVPNPWQVRVPVVDNKTVPVNKPAKRPVTAEKSKTVKPRKVAQEYFQELLNLRGSVQPALFAVHPVVQQTTGEAAYRQLLHRVTPEQRIRLDNRSLRSALRYLNRRHQHPLEHQVWITLGDWVLTDKQRLRDLLKFLQGTRKLNSGVVLSLNIAGVIRYRTRSIRILPLLKQCGVQLGLDGVKQHNAELSALLEISQAAFVRTHQDLLNPVESTAAGAISENLQQLLSYAQEADFSLVIDGVRDVNMMNALCETSAAYLQGEVLDKFKR